MSSPPWSGSKEDIGGGMNSRSGTKAIAVEHTGHLRVMLETVRAGGEAGRFLTRGMSSIRILPRRTQG